MRYLCVLIACVVAACSANKPSDVQDKKTPAPKIMSAPLSVVPNTKHGWKIDKAQSYVHFTASQNGEAFKGGFEDFTAQIIFDPHDLARANVRARIDLGSVETGDRERDEALPGKDWFYIEKFPVAIFQSLSFTHLGGDKYKTQAVLSIKGIDKNIIFPFSLTITDGSAYMRAAITLNRQDFNIGEGVWKSKDWAGHDVEVDIKIRAYKQDRQ